MKLNFTYSIGKSLRLSVLSVVMIFMAMRSTAQITVTATAGTLGPTVYTQLRLAINAINAGTHQGAITISVTGNTTETAESDLNYSGSGAASYTSVLIKPATGVTATITGNLPNDLLKIYGSNVTIDGSNTVGGTTRNLTMINNNTGCNFVVEIGNPSATLGATNNTVENCILTNGGYFTYALIGVESGTIVGNNAEAPNSNCTIKNNLLTNAQFGILYLGDISSPDQNLTITGNTVSTIGKTGILTDFIQNSNISFNNVNTINGNFGSGIQLAGIYILDAAYNVNIASNNITNIHALVATNTGAWGIVLWADYVSSINIYNNFISDIACRGSAANVYNNSIGIFINDGSGYNIYHNTVNLTTNQTLAGGLPAAFFVAGGGAPAGAVNLRDNILANNMTGGSTQRYSIITGATSPVFASINNNDYYTTAANLGDYIGTNEPTLAAIQSSFGSNLNSIVFNPSFVGTPNLHLQVIAGNSPLNVGAFITTPSITTDIDGDTRITPTIGADELILCPPAITGTPTTICQGATTNLTDASPGGTWASGSTGVASVSATGVVTGVSGGTAVISYTIGTCTVTQNVTVNPVTPVLGTFAICQGSTTTLTDATAGGTWFSGTTSVATIVTGSGFLSAVGPGTSTITYTTSAGCTATVVESVTALPTAILGTMVICSGSSSTLTDPVAGGVWSSSNSAVASVGSSTGVVTGLGTAAATATITYTIAGSCYVTTTVTVNPSPAPVSGTPAVCAGLTTTLTDATTGGTWGSSNTSVATIGSISGVVTGVNPGTTTIVYTNSFSCPTSVVLTVNPSPLGISGTTALCAGQVTTMSDATAGGTWLSSDPTVASIGSGSGFTQALAAGTTTITYTLPAGCTSVMILTVNPLPASITGNATVCAGINDTLYDTTPGGLWGSSNTSVATIAAGTGIAQGVTPGTTTISYRLPATGCSISIVLTVNPSPVAISGNHSLCVGLSTSLTDGTPGGTWSSSDPTIASIITATGVASGVANGTSTITYTLSAGCTAVTDVTVNPVPGPINGTTNGCIGFSTTLTDATPGGTWSSTTPVIATIGSATGVVNALAAGSTTMSYTLTSTGCYSTMLFTVNPPPAAISGTPYLCEGSSSIFTDASGGGAWSSSNTLVATIGSSSGLATGITAGTTLITYTLSSTACYRSYLLTVTTPPTPISGPATVCVSHTQPLADGTPGGAWSVTSGTGTASVGSATGIVTGLTPGTATVFYNTFACPLASQVITINPLPAPINSPGSVCAGTTVSLSDVTPGGSWSASGASVGSATGVVTGLSVGTPAIITYSLPTGCYQLAPVSVYPVPAPILGKDTICPGSSVVLTDVTTGGVWSSSNGTVAEAIAFTGQINGLVPGAATITYTLISGCYTVVPVYVPTPLPASLHIVSSPIDTFLCSSTPVTLTAVDTNAGSPTFVWTLFGSYVGSGATFTYNATHGDFLTCTMTTHSVCASPAVIAKDVALNVWPIAGPIVDVTCTQPDTTSYMGEAYTFYATVTYGGPAPGYQWYVNQLAIAGANGPVFTTRLYSDNDTIYCKVTGNSPCDTGSYIGYSNTKVIHGQGYLSVSNTSVGNDLSLFPNPNNGSFVLSGKIGGMVDESVALEVVDMLGRTVYTGNAIAQNGALHAEIKLNNEASGNYLLRVHTPSGNETLHFVLGK